MLPISGRIGFPLDRKEIFDVYIRKIIVLNTIAEKESIVRNEVPHRDRFAKGMILIVEDDKNVVKLIDMTLTETGYCVSKARDGKEAIYQLNRQRPDLIISDIMMPEMDGYQLCHLLKSNSDTADIPFMFISARIHSSDVSLGLRIGADDYIRKPFDIGELRARVEALMRRRIGNKKRSTIYKIKELRARVEDSVKRVESKQEPSHAYDYEDKPNGQNLIDDTGTLQNLQRVQSVGIESSSQKMSDEAEPPGIVVGNSKNTPSDYIQHGDEDEIGNTNEAIRRETNATEDVVNENTYEESCSYLSKIFNLVRAGKTFNLKRCMYIANEIICSLKHDNSLVTRVMRNGENMSLPTHSVNVAILALSIGFGLGYSKDELIKLGTAALLHDIGMNKLPERLAFEVNPYRKNGRDEVAKHPLFGFEIIMSVNSDWEWLAEVVYSEHERMQRQGYPRGLKGNQIPEYAMVIATADLFEDFFHQRSYRRSIPAYQALQELIKMRDEYLASKVIKALMEQVSVYPITTHVELNTGEIGSVVATTSNLLRPVVKVVYDAAERKVMGDKRINLDNSPFIFIKRALTENELPA